MVAAQRWTVYDGLNPYADFDGQGNVTYRYLYGPAVDMIMARLGAEGEIAWYLSDHLGTVRDLADTSGQVVDHMAYDSFGGIRSETNPSAGGRFKFTAREFDAAIEEYSYRARYYDARIGRFTSEDPLGLAAGDANVYRYVLNRPTLATDPSGFRTSQLPPPGAFATPEEAAAWYERYAAFMERMATEAAPVLPDQPGAWAHFSRDWWYYFYHNGYGFNIIGSAGFAGLGGGFYTGGGGIQVIYYPSLWTVGVYPYLSCPNIAYGWNPDSPSGFGWFWNVNIGAVFVENVQSPSDYAGPCWSFQVSATPAGSHVGGNLGGSVSENGSVYAEEVGVTLGSKGPSGVAVGTYEYFWLLWSSDSGG